MTTIVNKLLFLSALALLCGLAKSYGQMSLTGMKPATSDSLQKSQIRYFSPGNGGENKVWDFSQKLKSKETSQEKRDYAVNKFSKLFPLEYGDSVTMPFRCEGIYCGDHPFREVGTTKVKVDAKGSIVLAENDTVRNVLRVHTIDSYSICMDLDSAALDTAKLTQIIDERYEWFLADSQYPIIEDVMSTSYFNMDVVGATRYAYCNLPDNLTEYYISEEEFDDDEQDGFSDAEEQTRDIIHYQIETQGNDIVIRYDLDEDATIQTIIANHMGMLCKSRQWTQPAGQNYSVQIDCYGLPAGMYILYINVNGKVYSEKVTL